ncbi:hypothetical protein [Salmonella enterica]|uniref:hypothetical protein n=1 Tax=Salmonella enterica TaxID=28901 RepID=UPI003D315A43
MHAIPFKSLSQWLQDIAKAERRANVPAVLPRRDTDVLSSFATDRCLQGPQICSGLIMSSSPLNPSICAGGSTR